MSVIEFKREIDQIWVKILSKSPVFDDPISLSNQNTKILWKYCLFKE